MDITLSLRKYLENHKIILSLSVLFIFLLFLIDPLYSVFGGTLNLSYSILYAPIGNIVFSLIAALVLLFIFSLIQTILIYKIGRDYSISETISFSKIRTPFYKLLKFNWIFFLIIFALSVLLYNIALLNNIIVQIILFIISILLWFVPQVIVMENETIGLSIIYSITYWKRNWFHLITLFITAFILVLIAGLLDVLLGVVAGPIASIAFFVLFVIPFVEILKTEVYLNKYNLLKPKHQLKMRNNYANNR